MRAQRPPIAARNVSEALPQQPRVARPFCATISKACASAVAIAAAALIATSCGYHVAGKASLLPAEVHTIAVLPFGNVSTQYKLSDYLGEAISRELLTRTRYTIVADPAKADAVLSGAVANLFSAATVLDPTTGRSTGAAVVVLLQVRLQDSKTGKMLFDRPSLEFRERYEISVDAKQYFDESQPALQRLSRDVGRTVVSAMLENF